MFAEVIPEKSTEEKELWQAALELYPEIRRRHGLACEFIPGKGIKLYGPVEQWLVQPEALSESVLLEESAAVRWVSGPLDRVGIRGELGWVFQAPLEDSPEEDPFELDLARGPLPFAAASAIVLAGFADREPKREKLALASCGVRILRRAKIQGTVAVHLSPSA